MKIRMRLPEQLSNRTRTLRNRLTCLSVVMFTLVAPQVAMAQLEGEEPEPKWLLPYCLVALLIGLAVYSMCRPSTRRKKSEL